ncbi:MAG: hypothetical protein IPH13_20335 [Planctomycetes bacterium]|nr:hypothetical protein [Planctomycetota bacterium]
MPALIQGEFNAYGFGRDAGWGDGPIIGDGEVDGWGDGEGYLTGDDHVNAFGGGDGEAEECGSLCLL